MPWKPQAAYLPSAPSTANVLGAALHTIARDLEKADIHTIARDLDNLVLEMTKLIKETNMQALSSQMGRVLAEFEGIAQQARRVRERPEFTTIVSDAARTMEEAKNLVMELSPVSKQIRIASDKFPDASQSVREEPAASRHAAYK